MATQNPPALAKTGLPAELPVLECGIMKYYDAQGLNHFHPADEAALARARAEIKRRYDPLPLEALFSELDNHIALLSSDWYLMFDMLEDAYDEKRATSLADKYACILKDGRRHLCKPQDDLWFSSSSIYEQSSFGMLRKYFLARFWLYVRAVYRENDALLDGQFLGVFPDIHDEHVEIYFREFFLYKALSVYQYFGYEDPRAYYMFPFELAQNCYDEDMRAIEEQGPDAPRPGLARLLEVVGQIRYILLKT